MKLVKLFDRTGSAKNRGAQAVIDDLQRRMDSGEIPENARMVVVYTYPLSADNMETAFVQCGMTAGEMIGVLEVAKLDIYRRHML